MRSSIFRLATTLRRLFAHRPLSGRQANVDVRSRPSSTPTGVCAGASHDFGSHRHAERRQIISFRPFRARTLMTSLAASPHLTPLILPLGETPRHLGSPRCRATSVRDVPRHDTAPPAGFEPATHGLGNRRSTRAQSLRLEALHCARSVPHPGRTSRCLAGSPRLQVRDFVCERP